ncbi:flagellar basal body-associated FliL family protein [Clostridiaceae bacterium 35-E11]
MSTKKVILYSVIGFIVTVLVTGSVFYFVTYRKPQQDVKEVKTFTYSIGELYANLKESRKILKVNIDVETTDEKISNQLTNKNSQIVNNILEVLRSKDESQLSGEKGQQSLREEILKAIKVVVPSDNITDVYFVEFIIQ